MRVLICCRDGFGHFHPLVPIARALAAAGHAVVFATGPSMAAQVAAAGFDFLPSGPALPEAQELTRRLYPEVRDLPGPQRWRFGLTMFAGVVAPRAVADVLAYVDATGADLLLHEATELAAPVVAAARGIPAVFVSWGPARSAEWIDYAGLRAAGAWRVAGLPAGPPGAMREHLYLDVAPPALQHPEIADHPHVLPMRHIPYESPAPGGTPGWLSKERPRRLVYVTLGTVFGSTDLFRAALEGAAADSDVDVLVTVGPAGDPSSLGAVPSNVHLERYVAQSDVLPHAAALVSHCGSGALMGAAAFGVPHVALPQGADQFRNAEALERSGAGTVIRPQDLCADAVAAAVRRALDDQEMRMAAGRLAAQNAQRPHPTALVPELEDYAGSRA